MGLHAVRDMDVAIRVNDVIHESRIEKIRDTRHTYIFLSNPSGHQTTG